MERVRRRRVYRPRINPVNYFDEQDFLARYRLPKHIVRELAARFAISPFISTTGDVRGHGLHPEERVNMCVICTLFTPSNIYMLYKCRVHKYCRFITIEL